MRLWCSLSRNAVEIWRIPLVTYYETMTEVMGRWGCCVMIVGQISRLAPLARDDRVEWLARDNRGEWVARDDRVEWVARDDSLIVI